MFKLNIVPWKTPTLSSWINRREWISLESIPSLGGQKEKKKNERHPTAKEPPQSSQHDQLERTCGSHPENLRWDLPSGLQQSAGPERIRIRHDRPAVPPKETVPDHSQLRLPSLLLQTPACLVFCLSRFSPWFSSGFSSVFSSVSFSVFQKNIQPRAFMGGFQRCFPYGSCSVFCLVFCFLSSFGGRKTNSVDRVGSNIRESKRDPERNTQRETLSV